MVAGPATVMQWDTDLTGPASGGAARQGLARAAPVLRPTQPKLPRSQGNPTPAES
jgi:hypothetical protein